MLQNTFCHIPGIGVKSERALWSKGLCTWNDIIEGAPVDLGPSRRSFLESRIRESMSRLEMRDPLYFSRALSSSEHWRFFPEFRDSTAYLDIETTGMGDWRDHITTISLYDGETIFYYVHGYNLDRFPEDIRKYKVVVTYNGKCFDIPFINRYFRIRMDQAHIDLRYILHRLGYRGGLKGCEKQLGLSRHELDGVDGYTAVLLWRDFEDHKNQKALETLLAYNILDAVNLETLMVKAYNLKLRETPFLETHQMIVPSVPPNPFEPDIGTIERVMTEYLGY